MNDNIKYEQYLNNGIQTDNYAQDVTKWQMKKVWNGHAVLVKSCRQSKDAEGIFCLGKRCHQQMLPKKKMPKATFSQSYLWVKKTNWHQIVYEKDN